MPKISIITPTYNGEKYLKETIDSVLNQTFTDFELIIINDCSKDGTENIINSYNDPRIVYIKNDINLNIVGSRNKGLKLAKGDYICFLDHDDLFLDKNKLQIQFDFLEKNIDHGMIGSSVILIDENGKKIGEVDSRTTNEDIKKHIIMSNQFTCGSVMFRRQLIEQIGYLDKKYNKSDDYDYWLKIGELSKMDNSSEYLFAYRIHGNNTTFQGLNRYKMIIMGFKLAVIHGRNYPNYFKQITFRFFGDFIIPNKLLGIIIEKFKNKI